MNKGELIETLAQANEIPVGRSRAYLESLLELIEKKIKKGEEVNITGLGKFAVVKRAGRKGRTPATGEAIKLPAQRSSARSAANRKLDRGRRASPRARRSAPVPLSMPGVSHSATSPPHYRHRGNDQMTTDATSNPVRHAEARP